MSEPIKVNVYYGICEFTVGKNIWHVLSDENMVVLVKPEDVVCMDEKKSLFSVILTKHGTATILEGAPIHSIMIHSDSHVTIIRKGEENDSTHKENVAKI
jgi:hypothetical protein